MNIKLLHFTPLWVCAKAIRTAWASHGKSDTFTELCCPVCGDTEFNGAPKCDARRYHCDECGTTFNYPVKQLAAGEADKALIVRVGNKLKHQSVLEHIVYTFNIEDFSRAVLQELSRHRMSSPTVKSTRYTLSELKDELPFTPSGMGQDLQVLNDSSELELKDTEIYKRASKYVKFTGDDLVDSMIIMQLENLRYVVATKNGKGNDKTKYVLPDAYLTTEVLTINARSLQNLLSLRTDKSALWEFRELANAMYKALPDDHKYLFDEFVKG